MDKDKFKKENKMIDRKTKNTKQRATVKINKDRCKGCELCIFYCSSGHLKLSSGLNIRGIKFAKTEKNNACIGCGLCVLICPDSCIVMKKTISRKR